MEVRRVSTQAELNTALAAPHPLQIWIIGTGWFTVRANGAHHVVAWGSSHVVAWDSSHVVAWDSSHVVARDSSHVVAWDSSHVEAWGSSHVVASKLVAVHRHSRIATVAGGVLIEVLRPTTATEWCDYYGVPVVDGIVTVYKTVRSTFGSSHDPDFLYTPGIVPTAPDWDGGVQECGGGLHASPHPCMALAFYHEPGHRFIAIPVHVDDIRAPREDDSYPEKVKFKGAAGPVFEVDRSGQAIVETVGA